MSQPKNILQPDEIIYKYRLIRKIDSGSFGQVWLAKDHSIDRNVAVKVLDSSMISIIDRLKEAQIGNQLEHSNLVKVLYADVASHKGDNIVVIVMDYFENGSIIRKFNNRGFIPIPEAIKYLIEILRGLEYLHEKNFLHGDIKPKNILIGSNGEGILTDYGISCSSPDLIPVPSKIAYTLHIAPETLLHNQISVQTDIYQMGMTAFRLLNGNGSMKQIFEKLGKDQYYELVISGNLIKPENYLPFIPRNLKAIINKAIHVNPSKRYQSALQMRRAFEHLKCHGYWTCDSNGNFEGINGKYIYITQIIQKKEGKFDFLVFKKNSSNGRETTAQKFCQKNLFENQLEKISKEFMQRVVTGISLSERVRIER